MIDGETTTEAQLKKKKILAYRLLLLSVTDDLIDLNAEYTDPSAAWKALKDQFNAGDHCQILTLMGSFSYFGCMKEVQSKNISRKHVN